MRIWKTDISIEAINESIKGCMVDHIGIAVSEIGDDFIKAKMPVDHRTTQPFGLLHGGASVALAESLGSVAGGSCVNWPEEMVVGIEINANHIKSVREGYVEGVAKPIHLGSKTQVWEIKIYDEKENLVCISRLTLAVVKRK